MASAGKDLTVIVRKGVKRIVGRVVGFCIPLRPSNKDAADRANENMVLVTAIPVSDFYLPGQIYILVGI